MSESPMDLMDLMEHERARAQAARQGYINWRMADLPAVYQNLMPVSYDAVELWEAEQAIRRQVTQDMELLISPWRRLGPECSLIDYSDMSAHDKIAFAMEGIRLAGMNDRPKDGQMNHPQVIAAMELAAKSPEHCLAVEQSGNYQMLDQLDREMESAVDAGADEATIARIRGDMQQVAQRIRENIFKRAWQEQEASSQAKSTLPSPSIPDGSEAKGSGFLYRVFYAYTGGDGELVSDSQEIRAANVLDAIAKVQASFSFPIVITEVPMVGILGDGK